MSKSSRSANSRRYGIFRANSAFAKRTTKSASPRCLRTSAYYKIGHRLDSPDTTHTFATQIPAELLSSEAMIKILAAFFGGRFFRTRTRCCLNFCEASDQLDPHIDVPIHEHEVTMIVCANAGKTGTSTQQTGLVMRVYGRQEPRPTVAIAASVLTETGITVSDTVPSFGMNVQCCSPMSELSH